jgi:cytochrome P450 family 4
MTVYSFFVAFFVIELLFFLTYIGLWLYIHTFHVNRFRGPKYFPLIGNALDIAGGLDRKTHMFSGVTNGIF